MHDSLPSLAVCLRSLVDFLGNFGLMRSCMKCYEPNMAGGGGGGADGHHHHDATTSCLIVMLEHH